jgi:o-succinylbenzoate synthase
VGMRSGSKTGWAESSPLFAPTYSPEFAYGVFHLVSQFFAPMLIGKEIDSAEALLDIISVFKGNPFAKSAVEMAWWTLSAEIEQKPLYKLFGGKNLTVRAGADFGIQDSVDILLEKIGGAIDAGYPRIKLKVKHGWDIDVLKAVRKAYPEMTFHIDCNSGYTLDDLPLFKEIDKIGLAMIEQPLHYADVRDHAKLQAMIQTPICLDESCHSVKMAQEAIELGSCRYINIKPGRVGGIANSLTINRLCKEAGIGNWIGGMLESAVGAGICIALATLDNMTYPSDIFPTSNFYRQELSQEEVVLTGPGQMNASEKPGNPFVPVPERLKERTLQRAVVEAKP